MKAEILRMMQRVAADALGSDAKQRQTAAGPVPQDSRHTLRVP